MSNNNKNKPTSTITKLIDYFNDNDEEEEEEEEEIYNEQNNNLSSLGVSGKFSRLYSYRDENEIKEEQNDNDIENKNNNKINDNKIFTTLYANEQPDSSFCCEEHPKDENKFKNNTEFIGRAVSFHKKKGEENNNNIEFREDNKEISKISKENTFTNTGINYIDNEASFSKEKINLNNSENNIEKNIDTSINKNNDLHNDINIKNDTKTQEGKDDSKNINNINNNIEKKNIDNNNNIISNNNNIELSNKNEQSNNISSVNMVKVENNIKTDSYNYKNNNSNSDYNIIYNTEKINTSNNKDYDSMVNNEKNNEYLMDYDEKTLEEQETEFLELEKQRKEKEKIKKKKEELLEQLRIKQEEKKALEKKLEERKIKEANNKNKKINEVDNNNNIYNNIPGIINNINENLINENIININNDINNNNEVKNSINNSNSFNNEENNKENELINSNNYQKFDSFKNINNFIQKENNQKSEIPPMQIDNKLFDQKYLIDSNTFDAIENSKNNYNDQQNNIINKNITKKESKENKNMKILKNLMDLNINPEKTKKIKNIRNTDIQNQYNTYRNPIELTLYNDALKRRKKLENIDKTVMKGIKLNSNKTKITNASYKVAIEHDEKIIEKIINRYSIFNKKNNTKYINIIGIALSLRDMKIFRELFKKEKYNINNNKNIYPLLSLKKIILSTDKKEIRKIKEINFLQQTWLLLNKEENKEYINKDIFLGLLKIIFSPEGTIKEIEELLNKYLEAVLIGINIFNSNKKNNNDFIFNKNKKDASIKDVLISPIENKNISYENLWSLSKYLKNFLELKKNLIAYKPTDNLNNLEKEKLYDIISKHKKINSNIINTNYTINNIPSKKTLKNEKVNSNFDKLYKRFLEKEQNRKVILEEMRKKKQMDELKELKQKPTISVMPEKEFDILGKNKENIYDRLYKMDKELKAKRQELIEEKEKLEKEKIKKEQKMNKLKLNSRLNKLRMNKSFDHPQKCKGFDEFVKRNREGRLERLRVKYLLEKAPQGEKYEEIRRRNITPPNITDIRRMKQKNKNKNKDENNISKSESDGNTEYFNLQIKLPNGKIQTLKVYENDDANEVVEEFCKIHSIDDNIKNKLILNIENCQKKFLMKENDNNNQDEIEKNEEEEEDEEQNNVLVDEN